MAKEPVHSTPWNAVVLTALPGLILALTRLRFAAWHPVWVIAGWVMVALYAILTPRAWRREGRMPVWLLIPVGMLAWVVTYMLSRSLASLGSPFSPFAEEWRLFILINVFVASAVLALDRRARSRPISIWSYLGFGLTLFLVLLLILLPDAPRAWQSQISTVLGWLFVVSEALMLLAVGLLVARSHGVLAVLVILGGYAYILMDSDYLWGFRMQDWAGLSLYLAIMAAIFFVVTPVAFLRARTWTGRAVGLFVPVTIFVVARLVVPWLVLDGALTIPAGEFAFSAIILGTVLAGWFLYDRGRAIPDPAAPSEPLEVSPSG